ncbi:MAG TPA: DUF4870 domain-containing protein [Candidatus Methylacidiphilales bacterium]|jgi:hypothetical protein|nr:DUF4870 domain-containing protein [Candidatus Methylacidiphilales bacterium]
MINSSDRILAAFCHLSVFVGMYFIVPLIIFFVKRDESQFVADHAKEVLNFHLSLLIYFICCIPLVFVIIGIPIMIVLGVVALICTIIGAVRAADSAYYRYPLTIRFF